MATSALLATGTAGGSRGCAQWRRARRSPRCPGSLQRPAQWPVSGVPMADHVRRGVLITGRIDAALGCRAARTPGPRLEDDEPVLLVVDADDQPSWRGRFAGHDTAGQPGRAQRRGRRVIARGHGHRALQAPCSRPRRYWPASSSARPSGPSRLPVTTCVRASNSAGRSAAIQALRHRAADLWTDLTGARAVARYAAACVDANDPDAELAAHLAQAVCAEAALHTDRELPADDGRHRLHLGAPDAPAAQAGGSQSRPARNSGATPRAHRSATRFDAALVKLAQLQQVAIGIGEDGDRDVELLHEGRLGVDGRAGSNGLGDVTRQIIG